VLESLEHPPFPLLTWDHYFWVADVTLPSWAGFTVYPDADAVSRGEETSNGTARLSLSPVSSQERTPPTYEQVVAFQYLLNHEPTIAANVALDLVEYCPGHAYAGDDDVLLDVNRVDDLRSLIRLIGVHVLNVFRDGAACIGFEFDCAWDSEHGVGVMIHQGQVIAIGQADCSFTEWIAQQGLQRRVPPRVAP
jgi:hypothetical protein